jgi:hypothetical protein
MSSIVKSIEEMHGGYSIDVLTNPLAGGEQQGGSNSVLSDLFIPFGLYYQNDRAEYTFYKPQKAGTIDNKLFDYLLDAVSKGGKSTSGKATRRPGNSAEPTNKTRKH